MSPRKKSKNYISNKDLYELFVAYANKKEFSIQNELPWPSLPEKIQLAIYMIAKKSIKHKKFYKHYSHHDDMVQTATIEAFEKAKKFNPFWEHPTNPNFKPNPFAYITEVIFNEFKKCIGQEFRNVKIAKRAIDKTITDIDLSSASGGVEGNYLKKIRSFNEVMHEGD